MDLLGEKFIQDFIRLADDGVKQNWHERNGGNLSYRLKDDEIDSIKDGLNFTNELKPLDIKMEGIAGDYFLVTGKGKYFRNMILKPEENIGIIQINDEGNKYRIVWGFSTNGVPTSELPTHLLNHEIKKYYTNGVQRVIYHCHPANIIALTFILPLRDKTFTRELWKMITECAIVFPEGVGVLKWFVPGGKEIAMASAEKMKIYNTVIWAHHGIFCAGVDFDNAFGLVQTIEKAAEILIKIMATGKEKINTITARNLDELAASFELELAEEFLK